MGTRRPGAAGRDDLRRQTHTVRAGAQESGSTVVGPDQMDQCIGREPIGVDPPPTCTFDANGHLISRSQAQTDPMAPTSSFPSLGPILFLMLLWSVVPFVIAISLARSRGEPAPTSAASSVHRRRR